MMKEKTRKTEKPRPSLAKRAVFHLITLALFFLILEVVLALVGIRPVLVEEDPYVGFSGYLKLFESQGTKWRTAENKLALFNDQSFAKEKKRGARRIFTLGGSVTYGRPFDDATSFSGWLREYLDRMAPGSWEVVNAGGISYASYRVAKLMEELVTYEPDLFIIYSGHNEFLEKRTYPDLAAEPAALTRTKLLLQRSRVWALGRSWVERRKERAREKYEMTGEVKELLDTSAGLDYYFRDDAFKKQVLEHYRFNLLRMIRLARRSGAEVLLVTIPVNEKDFSPFKSQHDSKLDGASVERFGDLFDEAERALDEGDAERALELATSMVEMDPVFADGHFLLGRAQSALERHEEAGRSYARAIAEDVCPLRALAESEQILTEIASSEKVGLVGYRHLLDQHLLELAGHTNLGDELFLDHAHPSVEAHGILARALIEAMAEQSWLDLDSDWLERFGEPVRREVMSRVDAETQARAYKNLSKVLIWAGKKREAEKYVELASEELSDDWEIRYNAGLIQLESGLDEQAAESFRQSIALRPASAAAHDMLGFAYSRLGLLDQAIEEGREAIRVDPKMSGAWNNLGTHYGSAGRYEEALRVTRRALEIDPEFAEAHNNLGKLLFDSGQLESALTSLDRAIELRTSYAEAMLNRGLVLGELGRYREAIEILEAVRGLEPRSASALAGLGKAHLALADSQAAIPALESLVEVDAHHLEGQELLIVALRSERGPEVAAQALRSALEANPEVARLHYLQGRLLAEGGQLAAAEKSFQRAIELEETFLAARIDLGNVRMAQSRHPAAIEAFRDALELAPEDGRLRHVYATALLMTGAIDEGVRHLERAYELETENALIAQDLALVYENLGKIQPARELFERALRLDPSLEDARAGLARLGSS